MDKRVVLDPGHGGHDPGAFYRGLAEKDVVLSIANYVAEGIEIIDPFIWVGLTRTHDKFITLQARCDFSNNMKADCFVSIHCNADPDPDIPGMPEAKGEEIWIYRGSVKGLTLALYLCTEVDNIFPDEPFRGIKEAEGLYVLKHTIAPAALVEVGFIDKSPSLDVFTDELTLRKAGAGIARGIFTYLKEQNHG